MFRPFFLHFTLKLFTFLFTNQQSKKSACHKTLIKAQVSRGPGFDFWILSLPDSFGCIWLINAALIKY